MTLSAADRIDRYLTGRQQHPFDWVNLPLFFDPRPEEGTEYTNRLRSATKFAYETANEMGYGLTFRFRRSSMSNGWLAYKLAEDYKDTIFKKTKALFGKAFLTTQNLKLMVAPDEMMSRVIFPNREKDFRAANDIETRFPDEAIVVPIEFENVPRTQRANHALSQGATFQDWTFEAWWIPRLIDMSAATIGGDGYYSRYGCLEDLYATKIQCGLLDDYRAHVGKGKDMPVTDDFGKDVPLADRAWERAKHIVDVKKREFHTDLAVGVLLAEFQIDDWLRGEGGPINKKDCHPVLLNRSQEELDRMDEMKSIMLPYIAENCMDWADYKEDPHLKAYIEKNIEPLQKKAVSADVDKIHNKLLSYNGLGSFLNPDYKEHLPQSKTAKAFSKAAASANKLTDRAVKRRSTEGGYFEKAARLFDDRHFEKLSQWEQAALPYALGAMESFRLPEKAPRSMFLISEPKGGKRARDYLKANKIEWLKEAYSAKDQIDDPDNFIKSVIAPNNKAVNAVRDKMACLKDIKDRGIRNIVTSQNFINIGKSAERNRDFVAAPGPQKFSPRARLALMMEWLDRNPEAVSMRKDWTVQHDEVQLATRALMIATGLVERPYEGGNYRMEMFTFNETHKTPKLEKLDLGDMILQLGQEVKEKLQSDTPPPAKEHYLSMMRILQIYDMYTDPARMNYEHVRDPKTGADSKEEIIHWKEVDPHLTGFVYDDPHKAAAVRAMRVEVHDLLLNNGMLAIHDILNEDEVRDLHEDYQAAWVAQAGKDAFARRQKLDGRKTNVDWKGPV